MLLSQTAAAAVPWHESLCLPNGGYWPERVAVSVTNTSPDSVTGECVTFSIPALAGVGVGSIRVVQPNGTELLYELRDAGGETKHSGQLAPADQLIVPVECPAHAEVTFFVYAGNRQAWAVPDFLPARLSHRSGSPATLLFTIGGLETLTLRPAPLVTPKTGSTWRSWAEVRVRCFDPDPLTNALVKVNLRQALACLPEAPRSPSATVRSSDGLKLNSYCLGTGAALLFRAPLAGRSENLFQIRFGTNSSNDTGAGLKQYELLLSSAANRVPNPSFEAGALRPDGWDSPTDGGARRVRAGFSADARFGGRALELVVRQNTNAEWLGWHSREIPVQPGATYLLSGWLKAQGLQGSAAIHAHFHNARGALTTSGAMVSTQPSVSGDSDWLNTKGFFQAPPDAATVQIHLTMNTQGTLRHDGIVLCEVVDGELAGVHSAGARYNQLELWQVNPLIKVFPDTQPQAPAQAVAVELAADEYQAFQLAVRVGGKRHAHLQMAVSALAGPGGADLPPVTVDRVGYVPIDYPSAYYSTDVPEWCRKLPHGAPATDGWAGWWPDPLAPGSTVDLAPNRTQPLWFTVHAPKGAAPGRYHAEVTVRENSKPLLKIPLTVNVLPFTLPRPGRLRAIFDFRFGPGGVFGSGRDSQPAYHRWLQFIAEHRLGLNEILPQPKFTYHDGQVTMDAAGFDETAHYCFDELGINVAYTPDFFYMFGWAYPPKKLFGFEPFTPEWTAALQGAYRLFTAHIRQKGWHDKFVYYVSDEPHFENAFVVEQMKKLCALIHQVDATIPIYSSTWRHCAAWDDALDLWGIGQYGCFPVPEMARLQRAGRQMWFTCDGQMATDTPYLATERLLPYYCFKYGVRGFEFWGLSWWTYNPWEIGWHQFIRQSDEGKKYYWVRYPDGDGFLAYPGAQVGVEGPVSTIRLEQIRQGLQDYEALALLAEVADKARATGHPFQDAERALAGARDLVTIPNAGGLRSTEILPDPDRVPQLRHAINAALVQLLSQNHLNPPNDASVPPSLKH